MIHAYQYLFYRAYAWQTRVWKTAGHINALLLLTMLLYCNALTLLALGEAVR